MEQGARRVIKGLNSDFGFSGTVSTCRINDVDAGLTCALLIQRETAAAADAAPAEH